MTLRQIADQLFSCGVENALWEALVLVEHFTGLSHSVLLAEQDKQIISDKLDSAVQRRCERYPLQYILGTWEFMGLPLIVREGCLIPRSDTEILVEEALRHLPAGGHFLDLCTGSGCVAAALLRHGKGVTGVAVDLYPEALAVAKENMAALGVADRIRCLTGDVREDIFWGEPSICFDVITANPPYVTAQEMMDLAPELRSEPTSALTDGGDGLSLYGAILKNYGKYVAEQGVLVLEHGCRQAKAVLEMGAAYGWQGKTIVDYGKNPRCALLWRA